MEDKDVDVIVFPQNKRISYNCKIGDGANAQFIANIRIYNKNYTGIVASERSNPIYNKRFYVPINEQNLEKIIKTFFKYGFVNAIPNFDNSTLNRSKTMLSFEIDEDDKYKENIKKIIVKLIEYKSKYISSGSPLTISIVENFIKIFTEIKDHVLYPKEHGELVSSDDYKNKVIYIEYMNNIFNLHGTKLYQDGNCDNTSSFLSTYMLGEYLKGQDIKLNFSDKGDGIYSANLAPEMFCFSKYLFRPVIGSFMKFDKFGLTASYMGSLFTIEDFENYTKMRILLEVTLKPKFNSDNLFVDIETFNSYNNFINKIGNLKSTEYVEERFKVPLELDTITISIEGSDAAQYDKAEIVKEFIKSICPKNISYNDIERRFTINNGNNISDKATFKLNKDPSDFAYTFDLIGW